MFIELMEQMFQVSRNIKESKKQGVTLFHFHNMTVFFFLLLTTHKWNKCWNFSLHFYIPITISKDKEQWIQLEFSLLVKRVRIVHMTDNTAVMSLKLRF